MVMANVALCTGDWIKSMIPIWPDKKERPLTVVGVLSLLKHFRMRCGFPQGAGCKTNPV